MREEWKTFKENVYTGGQEDSEADSAAELQVLFSSTLLHFNFL